MVEVPDPVSAATSAIALIKICNDIVNFVGRVNRAIGGEGMEALKRDILSLSSQLESVNKVCEDADSQSSSFSIEPHVREWIEAVQRQCEIKLERLKTRLDQLCSCDNTTTGRLRMAVLELLGDDEVTRIRRDVTKHQQDLGFYLTLINGFATPRYSFADWKQV